MSHLLLGGGRGSGVGALHKCYKYNKNVIYTLLKRESPERGTRTYEACIHLLSHLGFIPRCFVFGFIWPVHPFSFLGSLNFEQFICENFSG